MFTLKKHFKQCFPLIICFCFLSFEQQKKTLKIFGTRTWVTKNIFVFKSHTTMIKLNDL